MSLVFAGAASHAPGITMRPEAAAAEPREKFFAAYRTLAQSLEAARLDALIVVTSDHLSNFFLDNMPSFALGLGESWEGPAEEEAFLRMKRVTLPGAPHLACALAETVGDTVDLAHSEELLLDHGVMVPLAFLTPRWDVPVVPLIVNCFAPPLPKLHRCWALGAALRAAIDALPERIGLLAAGGLSHWPAVPESGRINVEWDRAFLDAFAASRRDALLAHDDAEIEHEAGPGGHEIRPWLVIAAACAGRSARILCREPIPAFAVTATVAEVQLL